VAVKCSVIFLVQ